MFLLYRFCSRFYLIIFLLKILMYIIFFNAKLKFIYKGSDAFFLSILLHVCGQMELLKIEFMNYGAKSKNLSEDFRVLASRHLYLMEHAELLIDVISVVLVAQLLFSCLIICFIGKYLKFSFFSYVI